MTNTTSLDSVDRTPNRVLDGMMAAHKPYKADDCIPCGAVARMGFFFDGFGRHRDIDDPATSRYSNICRLWEAHRDNLDRRREKMPNQFWYPFYYSGLGTPLNKDAENNEIVSAAAKAAAGSAGPAADILQNTARDVSGVSRMGDIEKARKRARQALIDALDEMSWRPIAQTFEDAIAHARTLPDKTIRVLQLAGERRWVRRTMAAGRAAMYDIKKNPLKAAVVFAKAISVDVVLDAIPFVRDSRFAAMVFGTGVEDRLNAALKQFENAYRDVKTSAGKVQRIEVSVFAADRGCVIARAFVNELVRKYKGRSDLDLRMVPVGEKGDPIEIRFLGLLDAVSSVMAENELVAILPFVGMIKQHHGDRELAVPAAVQKCVHFAAAHELRFYQRLDSLEKTRGEQYLYPGTSEDITGGAPPGSLGFRAELQRVALRDMLHEGLMAGSMLDTMEDLERHKLWTYEKFTLAAPLSTGKTNHRIPDLIDAYRKLVPRERGLNFQAHMEVFLRWLAVRYRSPEFRKTTTAHTDEIKRQHVERAQEIRAAQAAYNEERRRLPADRVAMGKALARLHAAREAQVLALPGTVLQLQQPIVGVWERIENEAAEQVRQRAAHESLKRSAEKIRQMSNDADFSVRQEIESAADAVESMLMSQEALALVQAWKDGLSGKHPLPDEVMMLFDMLVHDTMLTSWHDHVLSSTLYFRTRATDTLGETDDLAEAMQRQRDDMRARRAEQMPTMASPAARPSAGSGVAPRRQ
ncbi:DUF2235 domain-containing protein [Cupriavidus sp. SZY C1]|uniref:DUF2235 domain-containing protein n=1 Tax=Cupriavidus sp. SZY C1 TaxID=3055037 RepID=UPI0028B36A9D|nr:DUF2235 domain-containing protein [Cupriavidus sp. SZY C1]MDT6962066.1 DUF2235 domain-containing protein [Cupriavidus sp. SZY C1]